MYFLSNCCILCGLNHIVAHILSTHSPSFSFAFSPTFSSNWHSKYWTGSSLFQNVSILCPHLSSPTLVFNRITSDLVLEHSLFHPGIHMSMDDYLVSFRLKTKSFAFHHNNVSNSANLFSTML